MQDRLRAVVVAAKKGHQCAYPVLIHHLRGLIYKVHHRKVAGQIRLDDWFSEALELLLKCIRRYDLNKKSAKFSTYFTTALTNRATDLIRQYYTGKARFRQEMLSQDSEDFQGLEIGTDGLNPEKLYLIREGIGQLDLADTADFRAAVRFLIGLEVNGPKQRTTRRFGQMQYRFKQALRAAI
ncbi:sigma factor [Eupransor demetentiae]|uniref:Sigma24 family (RpoE) n=1 Tax=Eupransor demetentiae TaxID=3109584 RepID=A0ABM9N5E7_9LACO|nr:DNA-directed RNA polymerase specialized sigma subunit [Lactobacillaceae bacterium LMG 33000]